MKLSKLIITIPFLFYCIIGTCQVNNFQYLPALKGEIANYKRLVVNGDKKTLIEEAQYDYKSRITSKKIYNFYEGFIFSQQQRFETIYKGDSIYEFSCNCENIDGFVKGFKIRNYIKKKEGIEEELIKIDDPRELASVAITVLNKKGLIISKGHYSENGYPTKTKTITYQYDKLGRLTKEIEKSDEFGTIGSSVTQLIYNNKGEYTGKIKTSLIYYNASGNRIEKHIITYDKNSIEINNKFFVNGTLNSERICLDSNVTTKMFFYSSNEIPKRRIGEIITYNTNGYELSISRFYKNGNEYENIQKTYDSNNNLLSISYFNKEKILLWFFEFQYDNNNNWTALMQKFYNTNMKKRKEKGAYETIFFKQLLTYLPNK